MNAHVTCLTLLTNNCQYMYNNAKLNGLCMTVKSQDVLAASICSLTNFLARKILILTWSEEICMISAISL